MAAHSHSQNVQGGVACSAMAPQEGQTEGSVCLLRLQPAAWHWLGIAMCSAAGRCEPAQLVELPAFPHVCYSATVSAMLGVLEAQCAKHV